MFANNPAYTLQKEHKGVRIYTPANIMGDEGYHESRYIAATEQLIYSSAGCTKDLLQAIATEILTQCNESNPKLARSNIAVLANNILYRLQHPVDQLCAVRMGCILSFMETGTAFEDPKKTESFWIDKKLELANNDPEMFSFFFVWGISNTPTYREALELSTASDYFNKRNQSLAALTPIILSKEK